MPRRASAVLVGIAICATNVSAISAGERTISVTGQGSATAPPDMATIVTGVVTRAETAKDALEANNRAMERVMELLKTRQVASKDMQTSNFSVRPEYERERRPRGSSPPEIVGYNVTNQLRVRVRNLPNLGDVLDALVSAGSNQISGITFAIDDPEGVLNQARNRAVANAKRRAELYAHAVNAEVGQVLSISEQSAHVPRPQPFFARAEAAMADVPVATGEQELTATIHVVFELNVP